MLSVCLFVAFCSSVRRPWRTSQSNWLATKDILCLQLICLEKNINKQLFFSHKLSCWRIPDERKKRSNDRCKVSAKKNKEEGGSSIQPGNHNNGRNSSLGATASELKQFFCSNYYFVQIIHTTMMTAALDHVQSKPEILRTSRWLLKQTTDEKSYWANYELALFNLLQLCDSIRFDKARTLYVRLVWDSTRWLVKLYMTLVLYPSSIWCFQLVWIYSKQNCFCSNERKHFHRSLRI